MLLECCGAVFVATPDDHGAIRGRPVEMPRANVMLEFGLVAGRLGRPNIALCRYGRAELPSDLEGLTVVQMAPLASAEREDCRRIAQHKLHLWSSELVVTAEKIVRTEIVHGYTGRWTFAAHLTKWRGLQVDWPDFAELNGFLDLHAGGDRCTSEAIRSGKERRTAGSPSRCSIRDARVTHLFKVNSASPTTSRM